MHLIFSHDLFVFYKHVEELSLDPILLFGGKSFDFHFFAEYFIQNYMKRCLQDNALTLLGQPFNVFHSRHSALKNVKTIGHDLLLNQEDYRVEDFIFIVPNIFDHFESFKRVFNQFLFMLSLNKKFYFLIFYFTLFVGVHSSSKQTKQIVVFYFGYGGCNSCFLGLVAF